MGIHAFFTGIALGIQQDYPGWSSLLLAILLHKWAEALTVGISFTKNQLGVAKSVKLALIFVASTPLGVVIGLFLSGENKIVLAIFMGISCGTFVYIACVEIIVEEFSVAKNKWWKLLCYLVGATFMGMVFFIEKWTGSDD
jgi:zinc transporter 1/2/3